MYTHLSSVPGLELLKSLGGNNVTLKRVIKIGNHFENDFDLKGNCIVWAFPDHHVYDARNKSDASIIF